MGYLSRGHHEQLDVGFPDVSTLRVFEIAVEERVVADLAQHHELVEVGHRLGSLHLHRE